MPKPTLTPRQVVIHERTIERYLVKRVEAAGGLVRKLRWIARRGAQDRFVLLPGGVIWLVELKRPRKGAEAHQSREHKRMADLGANTTVLSSIEMVDAWCLTNLPRKRIIAA